MDDNVTFTWPAVARAVAAVLGDRALVTQGDKQYTYADIVDRSTRLANYLHSRGLGCHTERSSLAGHEVGQDLLGIYAYNGNEWVEAFLGSFLAPKCVPLGYCDEAGNRDEHCPIRPHKDTVLGAWAEKQRAARAVGRELPVAEG